MARPVVCVVGAGTVGLEGLLAARAALGASVELRLIAPDREFRHRPMSAASLFRPAPERGVSIAEIAGHAGADRVADSAVAVYETERQVLTRDGDTVDFDFLLLALGARSRRALRQGHLWQRGGDPSFLDQIISGILAGEVRSVAVAAPRGARWPVPAYELALVLAWTAAGTEARVTLITAEEHLLAGLGAEATDLVARELDAAGVTVMGGVEPIDESRDDPDPAEPVRLVLAPADPTEMPIGGGSRVGFDRLISLPTVDGPFLAGVKTDAAGFIEVDEGLKVCASERVWAAGGCIAAALELSALGALQADAAIGAIAAAIAGTEGDGAAWSSAAPELTGMLLSDQREQWLSENPAGTPQPSTRCLWWPPGRAVGRMLAQQIAAWDPSVHQALPDHTTGLPIHAPVALGCSEPTVGAGTEVTAVDRTARLRDIEQRQLMAITRREHAADAELRALDARLQTLKAHQKAVIGELRQHGYLTHRA